MLQKSKKLKQVKVFATNAVFVKNRLSPVGENKQETCLVLHPKISDKRRLSRKLKKQLKTKLQNLDNTVIARYNVSKKN